MVTVVVAVGGGALVCIVAGVISPHGSTLALEAGKGLPESSATTPPIPTDTHLVPTPVACEIVQHEIVASRQLPLVHSQQLSLIHI